MLCWAQSALWSNIIHTQKAHSEDCLPPLGVGLSLKDGLRFYKSTNDLRIDIDLRNGIDGLHPKHVRIKNSY
jgi:hypothetical protein